MFSQEVDWPFAALGAIVKLVVYIITPILNYIYYKRPPRIPPAKNPLLLFSASTIARKIRLREISSRDVIQAYIERIKEVNPIINGVVEERFEAALEEAIICDQNINNGKVSVRELEKTKPLYGVPFTVKESCKLKGMSYAVGSLQRKGVKAVEDGDAVELFKNAGGIALCVTNTPEICSHFDTCNYITGRTYNPYDARCTAGGSSGGEGALIATACSVMGIGSDVGGSIRIPALFNGIFGHKPTHGTVSIKGHYPTSDAEDFQKFLLIGPMTRYAEDLTLAMKVLTVKCNRNLRLDDPVDLKKLKVFYLDDIGDFIGLIPTASEIQTSIQKAVMHLQDCGSTIKKYPKGSLLEIINPTVASLFYVSEMPLRLIDPDNPEREKHPVVELIKSFFGLSGYTRSLIFMKIMSILKGFVMPWKVSKYKARVVEIVKYLVELLGDNGVLIFPTFPVTAPIGITTFLYTLESLYCGPWNINGFPGTHVPMGLNQDGMPIGFQIIAAPYQDRLSLAVAKELEKHFGGWTPPYSS